MFDQGMARRSLMGLLGAAVLGGVTGADAGAATIGSWQVHGTEGADGWWVSEVRGQITARFDFRDSGPGREELVTGGKCESSSEGAFSGNPFTYDTPQRYSDVTLAFTLSGEGYTSVWCTANYEYRYWDCDSWSCWASDLKPATIGASAGYFKIDPSPPTDVHATPEVPGAPARKDPQNGVWHNAATFVNFTGHDTTSGIRYCSRAAIDPVTSNQPLNIVGFCTNGAGLRTTDTSYRYRFDGVPPTVTFSDHPGVYGIDETVDIDCTATDANSGIDASTCEDLHADAYTLGGGSHTLAATATDVATNVGHGSTSFEVVTASDGLLRLSRRLAAELQDTATRKGDQKTLGDAIERLDDAMAPEAWTDADHLVVKPGKRVLDDIGKAAGELDHLLTDRKTGVSTDQLPVMIDWLVQSGRLLATTALDDAVAADGDARKIDDARDALAKGDSARDDGRSKKAIDRYRDAWKKAVAAADGQ